MPTITVNDIRLYYEDHGPGSETLVFIHGLFYDARMWEHQIKQLQGDFRCVAFDQRGQGRSEVPPERSIDHDTLASDTVALIEALDAGPCHLIGLSQGGNVALRTASTRPDLIRSVIAMSTTVGRDRRVAAQFRFLSSGIRLIGLGPLLGKVLPVMFGRTFRNDPLRNAELDVWKERLRGNRRSAYRAARGVADRDAIVERLPDVRVPVLVMAGEEDELAPTVEAERIHAELPDSRLMVLESCGHMIPIEQRDLAAAATAIREFVMKAVT